MEAYSAGGNKKLGMIKISMVSQNYCIQLNDK